MSTVDQMGVSPSQVSSHTKSNSCSKDATGEQTHDLGTECRTSGTFRGKDQAVSAQTELMDPDVAVSPSLTTEVFEPSVKDASENDGVNEAGMDSLIANNGSQEQTTGEQKPNCVREHEPTGEQRLNCVPDHEHSKIDDACPQDNDGQKLTNYEQLRTPRRKVVCGLSCFENAAKRGSSARGVWKLQLKSQDKQRSTESSGNPTKQRSTESSGNPTNVSSDGKKQKRRKQDRKKGSVTDEYTRIRSHLRYLLHRMKFEQSLIVAYSAEGWKGQNLEKLKPEKELQRASSDIFRLKAKIRELFKHIDSLCSEGSFPASLFDSDGQIGSEDIYCAKCQSKELTADNDIILCDGACDRGFHQFCLIPPLLKEDIPPDDEGWLCPGCDCKVDSITLVNDYLGMNLSITDGWELVFPEAAATVSSPHPDSNFGVPSDDSEDDDYDPDGPVVDEKSEGGGSGSDESDFTSASEELTASRDEKYLGLPSDDSEDDDYNPDGPGPDEPVREESSGSDFSSDSEDLDAVLEDNELAGENENLNVIQHGGMKKRSSNSEPVPASEPDDILDGPLLLAGKRNVERLDYRKLYDEAYGNGSSDSSDDEDYTDATMKKPRNKSTVTAPFSTSGSHAIVNSKEMEQAFPNNEITPNRKWRRKSNVKTESSQTTRALKRRGAYKKLGEAVIQRLHESFQENQYPDLSTKEKLAKELELTVPRVNKWFENSRWRYNHPLTEGGSSSKKSSSRKNVTQVPGTDTKKHQGGGSDVDADAICNGAQNGKPLKKDADNVTESCSKGAGDTKLEAPEGSKSQSRGRKRKSDKRTMEAELSIEGTNVGASSSQTPQVSGRKSRRRNSVG